MFVLSDDKQKEFSESGSPIYRHDSKEVEFEGVTTIDEEAKEKLEEHIETHVGVINMAFHEIISTHVHIDVYHVAPTEERPFHVLITHGMSDRPMSTPEECEQWRYAELMCFLPNEIELTEEGIKDHHNFWAIENLKYLARFPHVYDTWLGHGHTLQNGDPIEPYTNETELCASLLLPTIMLPKEFSTLNVRDDKTIYIYNVFPIYLEEVNYKMKHGVDALLDKFDQYGLSDVYDIHRVNTCKKKWFPFR